MAKTITGTVSSIAGNKTIVITCQWRLTHPLYKKQYTVSSKYMAHDEKNECKVGDKVVISESRPLSARKRYVLNEILSRATLTVEDKKIIEGDDTAKEKAKKTEDEEEKESK